MTMLNLLLLLFMASSGPAAQSSLEARLAWPRPPLSSGTRALAEELAQAWEAKGRKVELLRAEFELELPRWGLLRVLDDQDTELRRRGFTWDPAVVPTRAWPSVGIGPGAAYGQAMGPVLDVGDGSLAALERLRSARLEVLGSVALCRCTPEEAGRQVLELAAAGCVAVLFELPEPVERARAVALNWPASATPDGEQADPRTPVPVFVVHRIEAEALREQLVARRMEGEDGRRRSFRVGPGPLQVEVSLQAERVQLQATSLWVGPADGGAARLLYTAALDRLGSPLGAASAPAGTSAAALRALLPETLSLAPDEGVVFLDGSAYGALSARSIVSSHQERLRSLEALLELEPPSARTAGVHSNLSALAEAQPGLAVEQRMVGGGDPGQDG